jgi:hypothetical protein
MARISYDERTAAAYKAVREVPRDGLLKWREAVRRHLSPTEGMTLVDIGAGTGQFAAAFSDWFRLNVLVVEPSAAMRVRFRGHRPFTCSREMRDPPRSPSRGPRPHPTGVPGQIGQGRTRPMVPRDRLDGRCVPLRCGYV